MLYVVALRPLKRSSKQRSSHNKAYTLYFSEFDYEVSVVDTLESMGKHVKQALNALVESYRAKGLKLPKPMTLDLYLAHKQRVSKTRKLFLVTA